MGLHLNWIAVEGGDKAALLERLGFEACGAASDEVGSEYACAVLPGGWVIIVSGEMKLKLDELLPVVSAQGFALGGEVEEHVMFSRLVAFRDGAQAWAVVHDADADDDLSVSGEPPAPFMEVRAKLAAEQARDEEDGADYMFDVPVRLGQQLCGYATDTPAALEWTVLERVRPQRAPRHRPLLASQIRSELMPLLETLGWAPATVGWIVTEFSVDRVLENRRQRMWLDWRDDPKWLSIRVLFEELESAAPDSKTKILGEVRKAREPAWRSLAERLRGLIRRPPDEERVALVVARARDEILAADRLLTRGEPDPRIHVQRGSIEDLLTPAP